MQTRRKQITQCRATTLCKKKVLEHGCFCVDHELLWIAKCGEPSVRIRTKHKKMYRQFQNQQDREFVFIANERVNAMVQARGRELRQRMELEADVLHKMLAKQTKQVLTGMNQLGGVEYVHDATLHGFGEHAPTPADRNLVLVVDDGAEGRAPRGDWGLSTSAYGPAGEGQPEVPASDVHRSSK